MLWSTIWKLSSRRTVMFRNRVAALILATLFPLMANCSRTGAAADAGGNPARGKQLAVRYGCPACHDIPDMPTLGRVGPPLKNVSQRAYLAGNLSNTPQTLIRWIRSPRQFDADTIMPDMNLSEEDARHIRAFLYTLR